MSRPLAIDLFCGLFESELLLRANAAINEFVAGRTENPNHVALSVRHNFPSPVPFEVWLMGHFKDAILSTRFAGVENVRGAQAWVGRARWSWGSFYLWGDVPALMHFFDGGRKGFAGFKGFKDFHDCEAARKWSSKVER